MKFDENQLLRMNNSKMLAFIQFKDSEYQYLKFTNFKQEKEPSILTQKRTKEVKLESKNSHEDSKMDQTDDS